MVKKLKQMADKKAASSTGLFDSALAAQVKDSAQQIWLAGMGAFSKAQAEGRQVFESLVKEGTSLQKKTQSAAEERIGEVTTKMSSMAGDVTAKAGQQWDKLESIFEERTAKALKRLGVPTDNDMAALSARIDALTAQVGKLS
ncbi:MAG: phasin family protein, partial [Caldimonas sp.]